MNASQIQILIAMGCYLAFAIAIGVWYAKKSNTNSEEYFLGGRGLGPWVAAMSAEASDMSGWLLMGLPGVAYFTGAGEAFWTAIGLAIGMINGFIISQTTIPPFIVTLAMMNIAKGLAYVYTGGSPVRVVTKEWQFIGAGYIGSIPTPVIILVIVLIITGLIMNKTKMGRHIYAVGGNAQAAEFSGIKVAKIKFFVHAFSGLMAGLAGIVLASRMYSGQPTAGDGAEMDAIAAVVVGGTSMAGGAGKIGGTIIGGLIIGVLNNGLNLLNVNSFWQYVVKGFVILLAVFLDYIKNKKGNQ